MLNKVMIIGRLGSDPKVSPTTTKLNIATNEKRKDKNGVHIDQTEWHNVTLFFKLAEIAAKYLKKGSMVYIEGKLQTSKYQDKEGKDRYKTEIIGNSMQMLGEKNGNKEEQSFAPVINYNKKDEDDFDLPF